MHCFRKDSATRVRAVSNPPSDALYGFRVSTESAFLVLETPCRVKTVPLATSSKRVSAPSDSRKWALNFRALEILSPGALKPLAF